jgi:CDGSH-type Zn-finger protein
MLRTVKALHMNMIYNSIKFVNFKKAFSSNIKIDIDLDEKSKTIDIPAEEKVRLTDVYKIKRPKMDAPSIDSCIDRSKFQHNNVKLGLFDKEEYSKTEENPKLIPISPKLGPFEVNEPVLEKKTYHWCSCGLSNKQPYCDGSHKNTKFKPISFKIAEKCESMQLCGCKLSKIAPFCDGQTCVELKMKEEGI